MLSKEQPFWKVHLEIGRSEKTERRLEAGRLGWEGCCNIPGVGDSLQS